MKLNHKSLIFGRELAHVYVANMVEKWQFTFSISLINGSCAGDGMKTLFMIETNIVYFLAANNSFFFRQRVCALQRGTVIARQK